eukprot:scaffold45797_cov34-Phaeocystis_antarctica.AAC.2
MILYADGNYNTQQHLRASRSIETPIRTSRKSRPSELYPPFPCPIQFFILVGEAACGVWGDCRFEPQPCPRPYPRRSCPPRSRRRCQRRWRRRPLAASRALDGRRRPVRQWRQPLVQVWLPLLVENRWNLLTFCARADELTSTVIAVWLGAVGAVCVLQGLEHSVHIEVAKPRVILVFISVRLCPEVEVQE